MTREEYNALTMDERIALIRKLMEVEGYTYLQVAEALDITRNMVAGMASRHKIKSANKAQGGHPKPGDPPKIRTKFTSPIAVITPQQVERFMKAPKVFRPIKQTELWSPLPGTEPVSLMASRDGMCRWMVGHHQFCGQPGFPFCARHAAKAYRSVDEPKSGVSHVSKQ